MLQSVLLVLATVFGVLVIAIFTLLAIVVSFEPTVRWIRDGCPNGDLHEDETIESSDAPPFPAKRRCTKCGRVTATATYAL